MKNTGYRFTRISRFAIAVLLSVATMSIAAGQGLVDEPGVRRNQPQPPAPVVPTTRTIEVNDDDREVLIRIEPNGRLFVRLTQTYNDMERAARAAPELAGAIEGFPTRSGTTKVEMSLRLTSEYYASDEQDLEQAHPDVFSIYKQYLREANNQRVRSPGGAGNVAGNPGRRNNVRGPDNRGAGLGRPGFNPPQNPQRRRSPQIGIGGGVAPNLIGDEDDRRPVQNQPPVQNPQEDRPRIRDSGG